MAAALSADLVSAVFLEAVLLEAVGTIGSVIVGVFFLQFKMLI